MASHRKTNAPTLLSLSKRQWIRIVAIAAAIVMVVAAGIVSRNFYIGRGRGTTVNEYSAADLAGSSVSRSNNRADLRGADANTSYVTVKINGKSRFVLGDNFTDVKSVLDAGNITLEPEDSVTPALTTKVDESTVISISRADTQAETSETAIAFNTVKKETTSLPQGQQKVQTEGQEGVLQTTSMVTRSAGKVISSTVFAKYVKKAPVDKVILVGTGSAEEAAANTLGDTSPPARSRSGRMTGCWRTVTPRPTSPPPTSSSIMSPAGRRTPRTRARAHTVCRRRSPATRWHPRVRIGAPTTRRSSSGS